MHSHPHELKTKTNASWAASIKTTVFNTMPGARS
jgi:hypothetical protein